MKSKFATDADIFTPEFEAINKRLLQINKENNLIDHDAINLERFADWFSKTNCSHSFYGSRFWEYPFAILAADIKAGMTCADIGCGSTPFTPILCELAGKEFVTGFDPDYVAEENEDRHLSFGARKSHIEKFGFKFKPDNFTKLSAPDNFFDRVFCMSVLEHVEDMKVKENGLREMARVLKPGGRLIITFDTGIDVLLNPILRVIEFTGLVPLGELDLRWPQKRFVNYGDSCVDVFGLVLEKPAGEIFTDYKQEKTIPAFKANDKYVKSASWFNVPYNSILMIRDLDRQFGLIRMALKKILKRYLMKILITGGAGFVGSALARGLKDKYPSYSITVCDNLVRRGSEINLAGLKEREIAFYHADLRLESDLNELPPSDVVIDASADPSVLAGINSSVTKLIQSNLTSTTNLLEWVSRHQARFIFLSTSRVYPIEKLNQIRLDENETRFVVGNEQPLTGISKNGISEKFPLEGSRSFYGAAKLASELFVQEYHSLKNIQTAVLRCGVIAGPGQFGKVDQGILVHWLASHFWKRDLAYFGFGGTGKQVRDFLHIKDIVQLIDHTIHHFHLLNGKTVNAGGGEQNSLSLQELTKLCQEITGNVVPIKSVVANRVADIPYYCTDNRLIAEFTGWQPNHSSRQLVEDTFSWLKKEENILKQIL